MWRVLDVFFSNLLPYALSFERPWRRGVGTRRRQDRTRQHTTRSKGARAQESKEQDTQRAEEQKSKRAEEQKSQRQKAKKKESDPRTTNLFESFQKVLLYLSALVENRLCQGLTSEIGLGLRVKG